MKIINLAAKTIARSESEDFISFVRQIGSLVSPQFIFIAALGSEDGIQLFSTQQKKYIRRESSLTEKWNFLRFREGACPTDSE